MTESQQTTVVGVFDDYSTAERVARELTEAGIPRESIDVRSNFRTGAAGRSSADIDETETGEHESGVVAWFHRVFGGEEHHREHAGHYAEMLRRGNAVVTVTTTENRIDQATDIMNSAGAIDVDSRVSEYQQAGYTGYQENAPAYSYDEANREREQYRERQGIREEGREMREGRNTREDQSIPVVDEELEVGKRIIRRGGVRVYSQVRDVPVEENITLREEHVRVERRPVDRPLRGDEASRLRDQTIEVTESAEVPVVQKRARVREEVVVGKETTERTERVSDTVRKSEVKVDKIRGDRDTVAGDRSADYDDEYRTDFRRDFESRYASTGADWDTYSPAYDYGYRMASDPRYQGRSWDDVENDLRTDYGQRNPNSTWERMKDAVRYGWDKMTGRAR